MSEQQQQRYLYFDGEDMIDVTDKFLLVEETKGHLISPVIKREWLFANEHAYWFPGSRSEEIHSQYLHAGLIKDAASEAERTSKGKLKYTWTKVPFTKVLQQGNDLRRLTVARETLTESDIESSPKKKRNEPMHNYREPSSVVRPSSKELQKELCEFIKPPPAIRSNAKKPISQTRRMKFHTDSSGVQEVEADKSSQTNNAPAAVVPLLTNEGERDRYSTANDEALFANEYVMPTLPQNAHSTDANTNCFQQWDNDANNHISPTANMAGYEFYYDTTGVRIPSNKFMDNINGPPISANNTHHQSLLGAFLTPNDNEELSAMRTAMDVSLETYKGADAVVDDAMVSDFLHNSAPNDDGLPAMTANNDEGLLTQSQTSPSSDAAKTYTDLFTQAPSWAKKMAKDIDFLKKRAPTILVVNTAVEELTKKVNLILAHLDRKATYNAATDGENNSCTKITGHIPLKTEAQLVSFDEKVENDPEFRDQLGVWLKRQEDLLPANLSHANRVQRIMKSLCHEDITVFGSWTGVKKNLRPDGTTREICKCRAFKNMHLFKDYLNAHFGGTNELQEWVRNTTGTRKRYHSGGVPNRKASASAHRKNKSADRKTPRKTPKKNLGAPATSPTVVVPEVSSRTPAEPSGVDYGSANRALSFDTDNEGQ